MHAHLLMCTQVLLMTTGVDVFVFKQPNSTTVPFRRKFRSSPAACCEQTTNKLSRQVRCYEARAPFKIIICMCAPGEYCWQGNCYGKITDKSPITVLPLPGTCTTSCMTVPPYMLPFMTAPPDTNLMEAIFSPTSPRSGPSSSITAIQRTYTPHIVSRAYFRR